MTYMHQIYCRLLCMCATCRASSRKKLNLICFIRECMKHFLRFLYHTVFVDI